jgi:hypothetical protein
LLIAAIVVFVAGIALAVAQPGDLGGKDSTNRAASSTTKPSSTGSTTGSTTGTTTGTSVPGTSIAPQGTTPTTGGSTATTAKPSGSATTTTVTPGGLGQSGAGGASGTHPVTGGASMLALGLVMIAAALALRRAVTA